VEEVGWVWTPLTDPDVEVFVMTVVVAFI